MRKRILSIVLSLCMVLALMPQMAFAADLATNIPYLDASGAQQICGSATVVTGDDTTWGTSGQTTWYVVQDNVTIGVGVLGGKRITVNGDVNLILADGYTLTVRGGIQVSRGNSLTIYGQAGGTGKLIADARATSNYYAGIGGGGSSVPNGDITINGGVVNAIGGLNSAGIGIGINASGTGGKITINGGTVDAAADMQADNPNGAAGIGCGGNGGGEVFIEINGGTVIATGYLGGAGIGCGNHEGWAKITINGGIVTATGNAGGAGIGAGQNGGPALITISGGIVTATGNAGGAGIGDGQNGGGAPITINGNAVIFASSISNQSGKENNTWSGVIFESNSGKVYGTSVAPTDDFTIPEDKILTIESGKVLAINQNDVTLTNNGKIYVGGILSGTVGGKGDVYYNLDLKNCKATDSTDTETYEEKTYAKAGSKITLTPDTPPTGYKFGGWDVSSGNTVTIGEGNTFTMPSAALTVTAQWIDCPHNGILTHTPAVPATYSEYGVKEYWQCNTCNVYLSDNANRTVIPDLESWKTGDGKIDKLTAPAPSKSDTVAPDKDGNISVTIEKSIVTVNGKTEVTVSDSIANTILSKLASSSSKSVVINATTGKNTASKPIAAGPGTSTHVNLPESAVKKLAEIENIEITLVTYNGKVVLDKETIAAVAAKADNNGQVTLVIETVEQNNNLLKIELIIKTSNGDVTDFNKGNVKVTVAISEALKGKKPVCVYIDEDGRYHKIGGMLNADGTFTFVIRHFSTYAIMAEEEADIVMDAQQKEETIAALADQKLTARSKIVTMKNGKKAVKITWYNKNGEIMDFDGVEIYRSTKKNFGYGKKPFYTTKGSNSKGYYINTKNVKVGTTYYYRVRGFVIIDGQKHYTDYSLKAIRTVK